MSYYFIDTENVGSRGLSGIEKLRKSDKVFVLHRRKRAECIKDFLSRFDIKASIEYFKVSGNGPNALDFQLSALLGLKIRKNSIAYIISEDKGYDSAIAMLKEEGYFVFRMKSIDGGIEPLELNRNMYINYWNEIDKNNKWE